MDRYQVAQMDEIPEGGKKIVSVKGIEFGIFNVDGNYYAWRNVCPHAGAPVCLGNVCGTRLPSLVYEYTYGRDNEILRCPWHGWEFDLKTGEHLVDPETKLRRGKLELGNDVLENDQTENLERGNLEMDHMYIYLVL
jgi:nitrite reductase/ring-hydroxylating ferredoxin subunit